MKKLYFFAKKQFCKNTGSFINSVIWNTNEIKTSMESGLPDVCGDFLSKYLWKLVRDDKLLDLQRDVGIVW